jgi:hypothetical protein
MEIPSQAFLPEIKQLQIHNRDKMEEEVFTFVKGEAKRRPVLLYCTHKLKELFEEEQYPFLLVNAKTSDAKLADLDNQTQADGSFLVMLAIDQAVAMRGIDYRAPQYGICLVLAATFENQRELSQGCYRVGRFGDVCERYSALPDLINRVDEGHYKGKLISFIGAHEKNKLTLTISAKSRKEMK